MKQILLVTCVSIAMTMQCSEHTSVPVAPEQQEQEQNRQESSWFETLSHVVDTLCKTS